MVTSPIIYLALLVSLVSCTSSYVVQTGGNVPVTYQTFYDNLSPYGNWIDYPGYGNVWNPGVDEDFRPYQTNGYWVYSDEGWAWQSGYSWGWAPFHYGRWLYDDMYGWLWIPGYNWAPAWVTWGTLEDYYCWAPLMPGVNINQQFNYWRPPSFYWNVCSREHVYDRNLDAGMLRPDVIANFPNRVAVINNFSPTSRREGYYSKGPDVNDVQRYVQPKIEPVHVREVNTITEVKHTGNDVNIYRPQVENPNAATQQHRFQNQQPSNFRRADAAHVSPFVREEQRPTMPRTVQQDNISKLPAFHPGNNGNNFNNRASNPYRGNGH